MHNSKKKLILIVVIAVFVVGTAIFATHLFMNRGSESDEVTYESAKAGTVTMKQTITAAGQVTAGETTSIKLAKKKVFKAVNVEEKEIVKKGQPLVYYKDGTHTDATFDGIVKSIYVPKHGANSDDSYKIELSSLDKVYLKILIPEDTINHVEKGNTATIVVNSESDKEFHGTIVSMKAISTDLMSDAKGQVEKTDDEDEDSEDESDDEEDEDTSEDLESDDSETGMSYYAVNIEFENDGNLKPGMSANSTITISDRNDVLAVPVEAVKFDKEDNPYVLMGSKSNPEKKSVKTGESDPMNVEILSGLSKGDEILIERIK